MMILDSGLLFGLPCTSYNVGHASLTAFLLSAMQIASQCICVNVCLSVCIHAVGSERYRSIHRGLVGRHLYSKIYCLATDQYGCIATLAVSHTHTHMQT